MSARSPPDAPADAGPATLSATTVRRVVAGYTGAILAALALTGTVAIAAATAVVAGATLLGFGLGAVLGSGIVRRVPDLPTRLGGLRGRRVALFLPAAPFGVVGLVSIPGLVDGELGIATLASASAIVVAGYALLGVASTRYATAVTSDDPIVTCQWQPPRAPGLDAFLLVAWTALAVLNAVVGNWLSALVWGGLGLCWVIGGLVEGRFRLGERGTDPEIRIHENGLVKQRPYTSTFVSWDDVDHVRLRDGELVFDRGLFDVRLDSEALDAPEDVLAAVEQRLSDRTTTLQ